MTRETITDLIDAISKDEVDSLTPFEYLLLKDYVKTFKPLLDEYERGLASLRAKAAIGDRLVYRGQTYLVRKMRSQTDWRKGYELASSMLADAERDAVEDTLQTEFTKEVTTCDPVY